MRKGRDMIQVRRGGGKRQDLTPCFSHGGAGVGADGLGETGGKRGAHGLSYPYRRTRIASLNLDETFLMEALRTSGTNLE